MSSAGAPRHDPVQIGKIAEPPFRPSSRSKDAVRRAWQPLPGAVRRPRPCALSALSRFAQRHPARPAGRACRARHAGRRCVRTGARIRHAAARSQPFHGRRRVRCDARSPAVAGARHRHAGAGARGANAHHRRRAADARRHGARRPGQFHSGGSAGRPPVRRRGAAGSFRQTSGAARRQAPGRRSATASVRPAARRRWHRWWSAGRARKTRGSAPARCAARCGTMCVSNARCAARPRGSPTVRWKGATATFGRRPATPAAAT